NLAAVKARGARLTDIPILLANAGLLVCEGLGAIELAGGQLPTKAAALLYDHSILQLLLGGSSLAHVASLSWHVPLLVPRREAQTIPGLLVRVVMAALGGFIAAMLGVMIAPARELLARFDEEPRATALRPELHVGVIGGFGADSPGVAALRCSFDPALPFARPDWPESAHPVVIELAPRDAWGLHRPDGAAALDQLPADAKALARGLQPDILLPFPDPDGVGSLLFGVRSPEQWRASFERVAAAVHEVAPRTRLAVRFAGDGPASRALFLALAAEPAPIDIARPRLVPGSVASGGPAAMDSVREAWSEGAP